MPVNSPTVRTTIRSRAISPGGFDFRFAPESGLSSSEVHCSSEDWRPMARKHPAEQWAKHRRQRDEEDRRQRVMVITEFDAGVTQRPRPSWARVFASIIFRYTTEVGCASQRARRTCRTVGLKGTGKERNK